MAVQLASRCLDDKLRRRVLALFATEKSFQVRLEIIQALGRMKIAESQPLLETIIADEKSLAEEKAAAIGSLVNLLGKGERS